MIRVWMLPHLWHFSHGLSCLLCWLFCNILFRYFRYNSFTIKYFNSRKSYNNWNERSKSTIYWCKGKKRTESQKETTKFIEQENTHKNRKLYPWTTNREWGCVDCLYVEIIWVLIVNCDFFVVVYLQEDLGGTCVVSESYWMLGMRLNWCTLDSILVVLCRIIFWMLLIISLLIVLCCVIRGWYSSSSITEKFNWSNLDLCNNWSWTTWSSSTTTTTTKINVRKISKRGKQTKDNRKNNKMFAICCPCCLFAQFLLRLLCSFLSQHPGFDFSGASFSGAGKQLTECFCFVVRIEVIGYSMTNSYCVCIILLFLCHIK